MKAITLTKYGNTNEVIEYGDVPEPEVGPHELLVKVHAASVNPVDYKIRDGLLKLLIPLKFPAIMGNDLSGVVVEVGEGVDQFKVGDEIYARPDHGRQGAFAEYAVIKADKAAFKPKNISHEAAAGIPLVGLTSWQAFEAGRLKKGDKLLIHAGSGGVGSFAIQLAKHLGAKIATTTGPHNLEFVKSLGADQVIDYKQARFEEFLQGMDMVLDTMAGEVRKRSWRVLKEGASLVSILAAPNLQWAETHQLAIWKKALLALANLEPNFTAYRHRAHFEPLLMTGNGAQLSQITKLIETNRIRPIVDRCFPLADTKKALDYSEAGHARGKIIIQVST